MLPFGIGLSEIFVVFLVLIIFVGPEGIPQAVRAIAKVIRSIRSMVDEVRYSEEFDEVKREILQPLEEARRYNPKRKAEEWVRREVEAPVRELTNEHVSDFEEMVERPESKDKAVNSSQSDHAVVDPPELSQAVHSTSSERDDHRGTEATESIDDRISKNEIPTEAEEDEELSVAALDPLDRGIVRTPATVASEQEDDHE